MILYLHLTLTGSTPGFIQSSYSEVWNQKNWLSNSFNWVRTCQFCVDHSHTIVMYMYVWRAALLCLETFSEWEEKRKINGNSKDQTGAIPLPTARINERCMLIKLWDTGLVHGVSVWSRRVTDNSWRSWIINNHRTAVKGTMVSF